MSFFDFPGGVLISCLRWYFLSVPQNKLLFVDLLLDEQISIYSWWPLSIRLEIANNRLVFELVPQEIFVDLFINSLMIRRSPLLGFDDCLHHVRLIELVNLLLLLYLSLR